MLLHHPGKQQQTSFRVFQGSLSPFQLLRDLLITGTDSVAVQQIAMLFIQFRDDPGEHIVCPGEIKTIHLPKRNKNRRILIHPRIAQRLIPRNLQPLKQRSTVLPDVEKVFQHTHAQRLTEAPRTRDQCHFRPGSTEQFSDQP